MRPLSRNRRLAVITAACASIVPGTASLMSNAQISSASHAHGFVAGIIIGTSLALIATSIVFLFRDRSACNRTQTPGA